MRLSKFLGRQRWLFIVVVVTVVLLVGRYMNDAIQRQRLNYPLVRAAEHGDTVLGRYLLAKGADPNATEVADQGGALAMLRSWWERRMGYRQPKRSALFWAIVRNRSQFVDLLLEHHADPNVESPFGETPLQAAAGQGNPRIVEALLDRGARVDGNYGFLAVWEAAIMGKTDALKVMVAHGVRLNQEGVDGRGHRYNWGTEALQNAIGHNYEETVRYLLSAGADPNGKTRYHKTPLQYARMDRQPAMVKMLVAAGAKD